MTLTGIMCELVSTHSLFLYLVLHLENIYLCLWKHCFILQLAEFRVQYFAASMARKIYLRGGLGVGSFRRIYGGSKRNGSRPPHFCKSSGAVARHILKQLANMNIIDVEPKG
jgi:hypothetical protein